MIDELKGRTALVTGASSGLGVDFARELASRGADLVLVARREARLEEVAKEIREKAKVRVDVMAADLADEAARQQLYERTEGAGRAIDVLVNNAGFGLHGWLADVPWERLHEMLEVDIVALTHLTRLYVPPMVARKLGRILQVSSIGAFQPSPGYAAYSAAKAYVLSFGTALREELAGTGVSCTVVCPGVTATEFLQVAGQAEGTPYQRRMMMASAEVARAGVKAMLAGRADVTPGAFNKLGAFTMRFLSRATAARLARSLTS
jgi:hypothetical protein